MQNACRFDVLSCNAGRFVASQRADVTLFWKSPFGEPESRFVVDRARF